MIWYAYVNYTTLRNHIVKASKNMVKNRRTVACYASWTFDQLFQTEKSAAFMVLFCEWIYVFVFTGGILENIFSVFKKINVEITQEVNFTIACVEFRSIFLKNIKKFRLIWGSVNNSNWDRFRLWHQNIESDIFNFIWQKRI